jgi:membrane-associated protease RseP (regulator of RpoE activity)
MENLEIRKPLWMKIIAKVRQLLTKAGIMEQVEAKPFLQSGDVILSIGDVICPTSREFREVVKGYPDKELPIKVLRTDANGIEKAHTINVRPKGHKDANEVAIGISFLSMFDTQHAVVAKTIDTARLGEGLSRSRESGPEKLEIPRGARIMAVDGAAVSNFYDVTREIRKHPGERITIDWRLDEEMAGSVILNVDNNKDFITVKSVFAEFVPFERLERLYKASGPIDAITMGFRKTIMFIVQTYATLKGLIVGLISPKSALMGPVGIIALSYYVVAHQPLIYYLYLLGLISAVIAVFNFLPLPPFDGGLVVLLLIEKIKGSALSERTQGVIAYTGWVFIGAFVLYVTFNDIVRIFSG